MNHYEPITAAGSAPFAIEIVIDDTTFLWNRFPFLPFVV
jgi:hypothetical protein